ncbi:hypothetical protein ThrDRAFT_00497 [Frankia casuarinae]|uniref:Uncharacterized protein n=3 Tax=Frankiaceae TaxID=74712 RepID=Q2J664_FRACC|nr:MULTISPECIES: hypothetical protein [unclassified Frankia]ABD13228.1 hypothetical protein Francci3_3878 [Frankia casuarinae]KDA44391.1 hypothetical protein BMG523Draft_00565 [Frankia sp. BMG5.23]KEZ37239.1 hypothetical protein CEDDRAFT_01493 [Frankia sp. CeD]ETA03902.1 hypothetical protein CcI6DRAFT_00739 [Frankia sp. CcI6]EYT93747.1 hypothetical protein ThrDRAFT_00497 [Frankia casuarinae]
MPALRPTPRRRPLGDLAREHAPPSVAAVGAVPRGGMIGTRVGGAHLGWRMPATGPLLRRAAGLVIGMAILIPAATALEGGGQPPAATAVAPARPPVIAAAVQR